MTHPGTGIGRRSFILATGAAMTAAPAILRGAADDKRLKVGVIGTGGRGKWIADLFNQSGMAQVTAVADAFRDRANAAGDKLGVPENRRFVGIDGYKKVLETDVDAVAIETPPYFHPDQTAAAIEAGKHVYLAKPVAVDVPGALRIIDAGKKAGNKLCLLVDFQTRVNEFYQGAAKAIQEGMIGKPVIGQSFYWASRLGAQADPKSKSPMARLKNWVFDIALSGDIIVEQNIHVLDVANWFLNATPIKAVGTGGRKARVDVGDCWDHFAVVFTYPNNVIIDFSSAQFTTGFDDLCVRISGTVGTVESHYGGLVFIRAKETGYKGGKTGGIYKDGAVANIKNFCDAIRAGKVINNSLDAANSTLTSILGRTAAYTGKELTWDQMLAANEKLDAKLELPPDAPDWKG